MQFIKKIPNFFIRNPGTKQCFHHSAVVITDDCDGGAIWKDRYTSSPLPQYHIIAPGRVNLIGEHIDHQNYNVLPCAIEKSVHIYLSIQDKSSAGNQPVLEIKHANSKVFQTRKFLTHKDIKIDKSHHWTNYIVAAYLGMTEYYIVDREPSRIGNRPSLLQELTEDDLSKLPSDHLLHKSVRMLVTGNLPMAAGLSSSSALVVCAAMCFNTSGTEEPTTIAAICANCERYVGTAGGGMDQAAICLSKKDEALWIGFNPLTSVAVRLPSELRIVIANTCREAPKVQNAAKMYNKRVFELKTACLMLLHKVAPEEAARLDAKEILSLTLRDVLRQRVKMSESELLDKLESYIPDKPYSKEEMNNILGDERRQALLDLRCGVSVWEKNNEFYLHSRIKHVLTENARVTDFVETCRTLQTETDTAARSKGLQHLGQLLNESGKSLREDFDASCDEIEELCQVAREAGAVGSRLTGAGWGGCTVSLVPEEKVAEFVQKVQTQYFVPYMKGEKKRTPPLEGLPSSLDRISDVCFATTPAQCARVITINAQ